MMKNMEIDNILAIALIGAIACVAMYTQTTDNTIVVSVVSGLVGYMAKAPLPLAKGAKK